MPTLYLERPDGIIAYDDTQGPGPLVICVPSLGDTRAEYRFLRPLLERGGCRVVTMDMRGHGESSARWPDYSPAAVGSDILALQQHLAAGPAVVIGTSKGAAAAVWAAAEAPDQVSRLVLIAPMIRAVPIPLWQRAALVAMLSGPWRVAAWTAYYRTLYPTAPPADLASYLQRLKANLAEPGRFDAMRTMIWAPAADCEARLPDVKAPALVVMGTRDPDFPSPAAEAEWIAAQVRGRTLIVEGAGHYPHAEMPEQVGTEIRSFLREGAGIDVA